MYRSELESVVDKMRSVYLPLNDTTLVLVPVISETTKNGLFKDKATLQEEAKRKNVMPIVISISPDTKLPLQPGDTILSRSLVTMPFDSPIEGYEVAQTRNYDISGYAVLGGVTADSERPQAITFNKDIHAK